MNALSRILLIIFPILVFLHGNAQVIDTMYFDKEWEQTSRDNAHYYRHISIDTSGEIRFYVRDFFPDGRIQMTGTYKSIRPDNKDGHFVYWYENGNKQMECEYRENNLHGTLREWYRSGQKESEQEFSDGYLNGEYLSWREDGSKKIAARYYGGAKHGYFQSFYPNGQMVRNDYFENDRLVDGNCFSPEGESVEYFPYIRMPQYPGGQEELYRFVRKELRYPQEARKRDLEGAVLVLFTIDEQGSVKDPRVVNGDRESFNKEALRIVNKMPDWEPGEVDGAPAPVQVTVPVEFRLR